MTPASATRSSSGSAGTPIAEAHSLTEHIESRLRRRVPDLGRVVIHVEPEEDLVREPAPSAAAHSG